MPNTIHVANLIWHIGRRSFWDISAYLANITSDLKLAQFAVNILAISTKDGRHHDLTAPQARSVLSRLSSLQLIEFEDRYNEVIAKIPTTPLSFDVPKPLPEPHWKTQAAPRLSKDKEDLLERIMRDAQEELRNEDLLQERVLSNFERVSAELEAQKESEQIPQSVESTYDLAETPTSISPTTTRIFALSTEVDYLHPLITQNLFTITGTRNDIPITLRYVNRKEIMALRHLHALPVEREKWFCAMSIASLNNEWLLASTPPNPKALEFVQSWSDVDVIHFYEILLKIRSFVESLLPYVEALPFIKLFKDFWLTNKTRDQWWKEELTAIPGISKIPPCEHIDLFVQECLLEEKSVKKIESEDTLALQIAGVANELAQSLQDGVRELIRARSLQINYMLFNEAPEVETSSDGSFVVPSESSRDELIKVAKNALSGQLDYHDIMIELL